MEVSQAFDLISTAIDSGRTAHGYIIVGDVNGDCSELSNAVLKKLFPDAVRQIEERCHPDVIWLEPQGASRTIKVERTATDKLPGMRDGLIEPISVTSYSGGWKVGIIKGADRMQQAAANAFLKLLEEPPAKTLFLLLTDAPDALLPTIISRTQRIDLPMAGAKFDGETKSALSAIFSIGEKLDTFARATAGKKLAEILSNLKEETQDADWPVVKKAFFKMIVECVRKWLIDGSLPLHQAFRNIELVEEAYERSERSMPDEMVLCAMTDRMVFP